jgi:hypothetical protein
MCLGKADKISIHEFSTICQKKKEKKLLFLAWTKNLKKAKVYEKTFSFRYFKGILFLRKSARIRAFIWCRCCLQGQA